MTADEIRDRKETRAPVWIILDGEIKQGTLATIGKRPSLVTVVLLVPARVPGQDRLITKYVQVSLDPG